MKALYILAAALLPTVATARSAESSDSTTAAMQVVLSRCTTASIELPGKWQKAERGGLYHLEKNSTVHATVQRDACWQREFPDLKAPKSRPAFLPPGYDRRIPSITGGPDDRSGWGFTVCSDFASGHALVVQVRRGAGAPVGPQAVREVGEWLAVILERARASVSRAAPEIGCGAVTKLELDDEDARLPGRWEYRSSPKGNVLRLVDDGPALSLTIDRKSGDCGGAKDLREAGMPGVPAFVPNGYLARMGGQNPELPACIANGRFTVHLTYGAPALLDGDAPLLTAALDALQRRYGRVPLDVRERIAARARVDEAQVAAAERRIPQRDDGSGAGR